jgi:hypothetical protein
MASLSRLMLYAHRGSHLREVLAISIVPRATLDPDKSHLKRNQNRKIGVRLEWRLIDRQAQTRVPSATVYSQGATSSVPCCKTAFITLQSNEDEKA